MTSNPNENGAAAVQTGSDVTGIDVGVIGVAAPRPRTGAQDLDRSAWTAMEGYVALVCDRTPIRASCLPLARADAVAARIVGLPSRVSAVFVVGTGSSESARVQRTVASLKGPVVISELDVVAVSRRDAAESW